MALNLKIGVFSNFLAILAAKKVNCDKMDGYRPRLYLRTATAIGSRASHKH